MTATARLKQLLYIAAALALVGLGLVAAVSTASPARAAGSEPCVPKAAWTETVVDKAAFDETVVDKPAFTETVVDSPAVAGFWTNFQPNNTRATFVGPPSYPTDARGTWSDPKKKGGPQPDASGVYANGNPDKGGNWFYRQQAVPEQSHEVQHPAVTHVVHHEAVTHTVDHPAVTCDPPVDTGKKVVVCKYVGTPPGTPDHIIVVSVNAIPGFPDPAVFPFEFADAQKSVAIRFAVGNEQPGDEELVNCPGFQPPAVKDASFTQSMSPATCDDPETLTYSGQNVTFQGPSSPASGPLDPFEVTAMPSAGHDWTDGGHEARTVFSGSLADKLAADSPDCETPPEVCPEGTTGTPPNCVPDEVCPEGTTGTPPNCVPDEVCPEGTTGTPPNCVPAEGPNCELDNQASGCPDDDDEVCPKGTDHPGQEVKHGEDPAVVCNDDDKTPHNPGQPGGPSNHPNPGPTVKGAQASVPTASHSAPKAARVPAALVPTAVDAGLAPAQRDLTGQGGPLGLLGIATALVGACLVGASLRPRRGRNLAR